MAVAMTTALFSDVWRQRVGFLSNPLAVSLLAAGSSAGSAWNCSVSRPCAPGLWYRFVGVASIAIVAALLYRALSLGGPLGPKSDRSRCTASALYRGGLAVFSPQPRHCFDDRGCAARQTQCFADHHGYRTSGSSFAVWLFARHYSQSEIIRKRGHGLHASHRGRGHDIAFPCIHSYRIVSGLASLHLCSSRMAGWAAARRQIHHSCRYSPEQRILHGGCSRKCGIPGAFIQSE